MKRPLLAVALWYITGILLAPLPIPLAQLFLISFALGILCLAWPPSRRVTLCALLVLTGWINSSQRSVVLSPNDLRTQFHQTEQPVVLRGVLCETPYHRVHQVKTNEVWSTLARLDVTGVRPGQGEWRPAFGRVLIDTTDLLPDDFFAGQTVEIFGLLRPPRGPAAEGLFDYRNYLSHQGIYHELNVKSSASWRIVASPAAPPLSDRFCAWARRALALGLPAEDESLHLEWALTLGWKTALTDEVADSFIKAATYHIFAVDGLRIAIITGLLITLFRVLGIRRAYCGLLALPLIWFYAAMTGWPASAIRAIVMIMVVFGGWLLARPNDLLNSLFAAALVILVWEPRQLFQAGFQLSFFVVLCIILILPAFNRAGKWLLDPDPLLPESLAPRWQNLLRAPARCLIDLLLTSLAAWLGSIPLVAWYFHLLTPLSGPANVLAVPLCVLVLCSNLASLAFAAWFPALAILFNHAGWFFMECIRVTSNWSAHWPGAYFYVPMPGLFTIALYYLILIGSLTGWLFRGNRRTWKITGVTVLMTAWCVLWMMDRPVTRLTVLPLEGGHAVYLQSPPGQQDWLIDCGNESSVEAVVKPFLQAHGVNRLSNLVLTHGEASYIGGAETIAKIFQPQNILASPLHFRSPDYRKFALQEKNQPVWNATLQPGDQAGPWRVLYPAPQSRLSRANDNPLILRAQINGLRVLLLSDLSHAGQNALLAQAPPANLLADIVIAAPPGESEPLGDDLLDAIQPRLIVVADSQRPANKRAGTKLQQRLARRNVPILYTSECDAVTLAIRPQSWKVTAMDGTEILNTQLPARP